jgi:Contractile injection system tube protein/LysM domain
MPDSIQLTKAELWEVGPDGNEKPGSRVPVQFNPETLKVSFTNQIAPPSNAGAGDQSETSSTQFVGKGSTKLTVQLWFDVTAVLPADQPSQVDVRKLTQKVAYFITARPDERDKTKNVPPAVRFLWGSFQFDGIMESLEESLEFFSPEGRPLRASVSLSLTQQSIQFAFSKRPVGSPFAPGAGGGAPGTRPLAEVATGQTVQGLAAAQGRLEDWQAIAAANGIENPRLLRPGQLIDLDVQAREIGPRR